MQRPMSSTSATREPSGDVTVITIIWLFALTWCEWSGLDRLTTGFLADQQGFVWRHDWLLTAVLHDGVRQLSAVAVFALIAYVLMPTRWSCGLSLPDRLRMLTGVLLSLLAVNVIKRLSLTSCPWDLAAFGGMAQYVSHWAWGIGDGGPGHCFPSGHASAGFAFFAVSMPWLMSSLPARRWRGRWLFVLILAAGLVAGLAQVLRGAHYPSHVLWTGFICWVCACVVFRPLPAFRLARAS